MPGSNTAIAVERQKMQAAASEALARMAPLVKDDIGSAGDRADGRDHAAERGAGGTGGGAAQSMEEQVRRFAEAVAVFKVDEAGARPVVRCRIVQSLGCRQTVPRRDKPAETPGTRGRGASAA